MLKWLLALLSMLMMSYSPAQSATTKATYVLVHGAWGTIHAYDGTVGALRAKGHTVYAVAFKGLGTRAAELSPAITLSDHINDVVKVIDDNHLSNIILVGHSYGGMIITGVAAKRAANIRTLVYLDAFLPRDGEALWDIATDFERKHYIDAQRASPGLVGPLPFPGIKDTSVRHPLLTLLEPIHVSGDEHLIKNHSYVYADHGAPATFKKFYDRAAADPAWRTLVLNSSHMVMFDQPDALNAFLLAEAAR
jgi:pimeloyl-ACP methyl ester carboxylesterase